MALPKIAVMKHERTLPSSGEKITFRPFLVKEEKILMMALQGGEAKDMVRGLKEIINNCVDKDLKVDTLPPFDLEYIFLQLRARSVGDVIPINYSLPEEICKDDKKECTFEKELKLVTKNHYRNTWLAIGMVMGIVFGSSFGSSSGNTSLVALGIPIGITIGIAIGTSKDKEAKDNGLQLDLEIK